MPRRSPPPSVRRRASRAPERPGFGWGPSPVRGLGLVLTVAAVVAGLAMAAAVVAVGLWGPERPERLRARAEAATRAGDWPDALEAWRAFHHQTERGAAGTFLAEARASLALDRAALAEHALDRAIAAVPEDPEPWLLRLRLLRVKDQVLEAQRLGERAYEAVPSPSRRDVLRELTLALLSETPDELARELLGRWIAADPGDVDAQVALWQRIAIQPRAGDPDRPSRIASLTELLARDPSHPGVREALAVAWIDAGYPDHAQRVLDAWPAATRDARFFRLQGRLALDYDRQPDRAIAAFQRVLAELPHDWKTWYRLARALQAQGRSDEARQAAERVAILREMLDPMTLGPRLSDRLDRLDDPQAQYDLAELCDTVGLTRLADAWRREARNTALSPPQPAPRPHNGPSPATPGLPDIPWPRPSR